nr:CPBP family intramembrane glutamic endopeptidase [uncultured Carboxylicivirga sp.]
MTKGTFNHFPPLLKLLTIFIIALTGSLLVSISMYLLAPIFNIDINSPEEIYKNLAFLRSIQILQSIFVFILPAGLAVYLLYSKDDNIIPGNGRFTIHFFVLAILTIVFSQLFVGWTASINQQLQLPEFMSGITNWITTKEDQASEITDLMLTTHNWRDKVITVFLVSVLPAIGEEWIFRGLIQRELQNIFKNYHLAVLITAIIFSAVHVQFLTFLPRFILGLMLGYMMVFSRNIWMPITAHFTNNFMGIMVYMVYQKDVDSIQNPSSHYPFDISIVVSLLFVISLLLITRKIGKQQISN